MQTDIRVLDYEYTRVLTTAGPGVGVAGRLEVTAVRS